MRVWTRQWALPGSLFGGAIGNPAGASDRSAVEMFDIVNFHPGEARE